MQILRQHPDYGLAQKICKDLDAKGYKAWMAGGCVRDAIRGVSPKDIDIATDAKPEIVESLYPKTLAVGKQFGTIIVVEEESQIEITTFRSDGTYADGRHPENVTFSTPEEDAARRDFTINAMFYDPIHDQIYDYFQGREDLQKKLIRTVGEAHLRFDEDKLRMMRAVRFVSELGFALDASAFEEIRRRPQDLQQVSSERVHDELVKLLNGISNREGLKLLRESGLLRYVLPNLKMTDQSLAQLKLYGTVKVLSFLFFSATSTKAVMEDDLRRLKFPNQERELVIKVVESLRELESVKKTDLMHLAASSAGKSTVEVGQCLKLQGPNFETLKNLVSKNFVLPAPFVDGEDLKAMGCSPGREMGQILKAAYEAQLLGMVSSREEALAYCKMKPS